MNIPLPLIDDIAAGKCLPFIGAGFSLNAKLPDKHKMPDWPGLTKILAQATGCRHREGCGEPFVRSSGVDVMDRPPEDDNRSYGGHQNGSDEALPPLRLHGRCPESRQTVILVRPSVLSMFSVRRRVSSRAPPFGSEVFLANATQG
jgi:hypothetical protein